MDRKPVMNSSTVASMGYDKESKVLEVEFKSGGDPYQYYDVPESDYVAVSKAESIGRELASRIKGKFRYARVAYTPVTVPVNVIYHSADYDGIFCREIARKAMPHARLIGWDYGDPVPNVSLDEELYMLDISVDALMEHPKLIWIDHHKTAIEKYPDTIHGRRIDGVAACRIAWQWFFGGDKYGTALADFVNRDVIEPYAVRLAGEYDVFDHRDPDTKAFQLGLRAHDPSEGVWASFLAGVNEGFVTSVNEYVNIGRPIK